MKVLPLCWTDNAYTGLFKFKEHPVRVLIFTPDTTQVMEEFTGDPDLEARVKKYGKEV